MTTADTAKEARIAFLKREIESIHLANRTFWDHRIGEESRVARTAYDQRRERLERIRSELLGLYRA